MADNELTVEELDKLIAARKWDAPELIDIVLRMARRYAMSKETKND